MVFQIPGPEPGWCGSDLDLEYFICITSGFTKLCDSLEGFLRLVASLLESSSAHHVDYRP